MNLLLLSILLLVPAGESEGQADNPAPPSRTVLYKAEDVVELKTRMRYTTLIVLPEGERILDFACGDSDWWVIDGNENLALIKPAKEKTSTNLNLIASSGRVYSFLLREIGSSDEKPDLKVFVKLSEAQVLLSAPAGQPRFVAYEQVALWRERAEAARESSIAAQKQALERLENEIRSYRSSYPFKLDFGYDFPAYRKPFLVESVFNDGQFTYIRSQAQETPALYEIRDGKPSLVDFEYREGTYIVAKVLERGYLAIGNKKLHFTRRAN